jgi:hypothetical protein
LLTGPVKLFGDGTAANPNAGLLFGNGYSYTSYEGACASGACTGGRAGLLLGNGGGDGGDGGDAAPGGVGGSGGDGGEAVALGPSAVAVNGTPGTP